MRNEIARRAYHLPTDRVRAMTKKMRSFLAAFAESLQVTAPAKAAGIKDRSQVYLWRETYPSSRRHSMRSPLKSATRPNLKPSGGQSRDVKSRSSTRERSPDTRCATAMRS